MRSLLCTWLAVLGCSQDAPPSSTETLESLLAWCPAAPGATASVFDYPATREAREWARRNTPSTGLGELDQRARALGMKPEEIGRVVFVALQEATGRPKAVAFQLKADLQARLAGKVALADGWAVADVEGQGLAERMIQARQGKAERAIAAKGVGEFLRGAADLRPPFLFAVGRAVEQGLPSDPRPLAVALRTDLPSLDLLAGYASEEEAEKAIPSVKAYLAVVSPTTEPAREKSRIRVRFSLPKESPLIGSQAEADLRKLGEALERYRRAKGGYPSGADGLRALEGAVELDELLGLVPRDPWGGEYQYLFPHPKKPGRYLLRSKGPDGEADTLDDVFAPDAPAPPEPPKEESKREEPGKTDMAPRPLEPPPVVADAPAPKKVIHRKVTLQVENSTWRKKKPWDVGAELRKRLEQVGVAVVEAGPADAHLRVTFTEEQGDEITGPGIKDEYATEFSFSMEVRLEGQAEPVFQLSFGAVPIGSIRAPFYESSLALFTEGPHFRRVEDFTARAVGVPGTGVRLVPALLCSETRGDAVDLFEAVGFKDDGPEVAAAMAAVNEDWEACVRIGEAAVGVLEQASEPQTYLDRGAAILALSRIPGEKARQALLRSARNLSTPDLCGAEGRKILDHLEAVGDASTIQALEGHAAYEGDDDELVQAARDAKAVMEKIRVRLKKESPGKKF